MPTVTRNFDPLATGDPEQFVDVYQPIIVDEGSTMRVAALFHGGGYGAGTKEAMETLPWSGNLPMKLARYGILTFNCNYRLSKFPVVDDLYPDPETSLANLLSWIHTHAIQFFGNGNKFAFMGGSAGGGMSLWESEFFTGTTWVKCVIAASPGTDFRVTNPKSPTESLTAYINRLPFHLLEILNHLGQTSPDGSFLNYLDAGDPAYKIAMDGASPIARILATDRGPHVLGSVLEGTVPGPGIPFQFTQAFYDACVPLGMFPAPTLYAAPGASHADYEYAPDGKRSIAEQYIEWICLDLER